MTLVSRRRWWVTTIAAVALCGIYLFNCEQRSSSNALAQSTATPSGQRAALPKSSLPLQLVPGERIALVGNSLAERMNLFGHFEALLHSRFPQHELVVRNFARPCDAVDNRQRPNNYTADRRSAEGVHARYVLVLLRLQRVVRRDRGRGASSAPPTRSISTRWRSKYPRDDGRASPRFVLVSPIAWEPTGNPLWPDAAERNESLQRYAAIVAEVAQKRGLAFVDLFTPTEPLFAAEPGMQYTINGCHLNEAGDREVALLLDRALFGERNDGQSRIGRISESCARP